MELYPNVTDSHTLKYDPAMLALRTGFLVSCKPGTTVKETLVRHYASKSNQQVKTIWGLLIATIKSTFDDRGWDLAMMFPGLDIPHGLPVGKETIITILYAACGDGKTLSKMNVEEASRFFETCRTFVAGKWSIQVPDPSPTWKEDRDKKATCNE